MAPDGWGSGEGEPGTKTPLPARAFATAAKAAAVSASAFITVSCAPGDRLGDRRPLWGVSIFKENDGRSDRI